MNIEQIKESLLNEVSAHKRERGYFWCCFCVPSIHKYSSIKQLKNGVCQKNTTRDALRAILSKELEGIKKIYPQDAESKSELNLRECELNFNFDEGQADEVLKGNVDKLVNLRYNIQLIKSKAMGYIGHCLSEGTHKIIFGGSLQQATVEANRRTDKLFNKLKNHNPSQFNNPTPDDIMVIVENLNSEQDFNYTLQVTDITRAVVRYCIEENLLLAEPRQEDLPQVDHRTHLLS